MNEFIQKVTGALGTDESTVQAATGGLMQFIQGQADSQDFSQLLEKIPGASEMMSQAATGEESAGGGGMLGGMMNKAASAMGGGLGSAMGLAGKLKDSGLEMSQAGSFVTMFVDFVKEKGGEGLIGKILDQVPDLKKLVG